MDAYKSPADEGAAASDDRDRPSGGLYSLPLVGPAASNARQFYNEMAPKETDSPEVRVAKHVFRWASVAAGAAAVGVIVL